MRAASALGRRGSAAVALAATLAGAGAGHLVAAVIDPASSPPYAVGSTVIDAAPMWLKNWAVESFGTADKAVLLASVALVTAALAALAGIVGRRRRILGAGALTTLVLLAALAAAMRPGATFAAIGPAVVTGLVGVGSYLALMAGASVETDDAAGHDTDGASRRTLIGAGVLGALGAAAAVVGHKVSAVADVVTRALPRPRKPLPPMPVGLERQVTGVAPLRTPNRSFYRIDTALVVPTVSAEDWKLVIDGDVEHSLEFSYDDILAMPLVEADVTLTCVSNEVGGEYVGGARWLGVPVRELLARARPRSGADQVLSTSVDGWTCSTPLEVFQDGHRQALLAVGMNGEPLPRDHGYPARLVTPGLYGYVGATKWVTRLTVTTYAERHAYWTDRGWSEKGPIKPSARIDTPRSGARVESGTVAVAGVAWAQHQGVTGVEVQVDDGPWQTARLGPDVGIDYWRQWWLPWQAEAGSHVIRTRCRYGTNDEVQTSERADPAPNGASGWHEVRVVVS